MPDSYLTSFMKKLMSPDSMFEWVVERMKNGKPVPNHDIELINEYLAPLYEKELDDIDWDEDGNFVYTIRARLGAQSGEYIMKNGNWLQLMFESFGYRWDSDLDLVEAIFHTVCRYGCNSDLELVGGENV